jgi:hypothetical protein
MTAYREHDRKEKFCGQLHNYIRQLMSITMFQNQTPLARMYWNRVQRVSEEIFKCEYFYTFTAKKWGTTNESTPGSLQ